jgi:hypothetical protein
MPIFNQSGFGTNEFGSPYVTPGSLISKGSSVAACVVLKRRSFPLSSAGHALASAFARRVIRRPAWSAGTSSIVATSTAVPPAFYKAGYGTNEFGSPYLTPGTLFASGRSGMVCGLVRKRRVYLLAAGDSSAVVGTRRILRRTLSSSGISLATLGFQRRRCVPLASHGTSSVVVPVTSYRRRLVGVTLTGTSTLVTAAGIRFNRGLVFPGVSSLVSNVNRRRRASLYSVGTSSSVLGMKRIVRRAAASAGSSAASISPRRRKPISGLTIHGSSTMLSGSGRRRTPSSNLTAAGRSTFVTSYRRTIRRSLHFYGTSRAVTGSRNSVLPPPRTAGLRVSPHARTNPALGIRVTAWTRPVTQATLRFTRWSSPV